MLVIICFCSMLLPCKGQARGRLGAGIAETAAGGMAGIYIGHSFAPRWSAEGYAGFQFPAIAGKNDQEWKEHEMEFSDSTSAYGPPKQGEMKMMVRYWTARAYDGTFIQIGLSQKTEGRPAMEIGAGYCIMTGRHIGIDLSYMIRLADSYRYCSLTGTGLRLTIDYLF